MVLAGRHMPKIGPRKLSMAGGIVLGAGYVLADLLSKGSTINVAAFTLAVGLVGGSGIGLAYVVPIAVCMKWFPDRRGMVTGLAVAGSGFGALIWIKAAGSWGNLLDPGVLGFSGTLMLYGVLFLVFVLLGSIVMVNPPEGWVPAGLVEFTSGEMLKTSQYYMVLLTFTFSAMAGLMVIGSIKLFGIDALVAGGMDAAKASATAGTAMAVFYSLANGIGRIAWGTLSDKIGSKRSIVLMCAIQGVMMLSLFKLGGTATGLFLAAALIGFNFGGNFALFPTITADFFGTKSIGQNYGWVFLAYGVAGIAGPQLSGYYRDLAKGGGVAAWQTPFLIAGFACLLGAVIMALAKPPKKG